MMFRMTLLAPEGRKSFFTEITDKHNSQIKLQFKLQ